MSYHRNNISYKYLKNTILYTKIKTNKKILMQQRIQAIISLSIKKKCLNTHHFHSVTSVETMCSRSDMQAGVQHILGT